MHLCDNLKIFMNIHMHFLGIFLSIKNETNSSGAFTNFFLIATNFALSFSFCICVLFWISNQFLIHYWILLLKNFLHDGI